MATLLDLADYKTLVGIPSTNTTNDLQLNALLVAVDAQFDAFLNYNGIQASYADVLNGANQPFIRVKQQPVGSIASIVTGFNGTAPVTWAGTNFIFNPTTSPGSALIYWNPAVASLPGYFEYGVQNIQVNYTAGYVYANVPADLQRAAAMMVQRIVKLTGGVADVDFKLDQYSQKSNVLQLASTLFDDVRMILKQWHAVRGFF
jgi:hypothetical protein